MRRIITGVVAGGILSSTLALGITGAAGAAQTMATVYRNPPATHVADGTNSPGTIFHD
jgi:hypothetical protein